MTLSNENIFRVTGPLCGEITKKASDGDPWCFPWSTPEQMFEQTIETLGFETPLRSLWRNCNDMFYDRHDEYVKRVKFDCNTFMELK